MQNLGATAPAEADLVPDYSSLALIPAHLILSELAPLALVPVHLILSELAPLAMVVFQDYPPRKSSFRFQLRRFSEQNYLQVFFDRVFLAWRCLH